MATVTGFTAARELEIENASIVDGEIVGDDLILTTRGGTDINAGNVRGPAGTDAAPGSVAPTAGTTPIRASGGRVKTGTPTEPDDAATADYVDDWHNLQQIPIDDHETRLDVLESQTLDARLDAIEAITTKVLRVGSNIRTTNTSATQTETNVCTVTIPNPINGRTYRVTFSGNFTSAASSEARVRVKHGINAVTGGTQIAEACIDFQTTRPHNANIVIEFTYTGTTGQSNYNVVVTHIPISAVNMSSSSPNSTRPATLIVDQIV